MTIIEEGLLAARGIIAILMGQRNAPQYFDLGLRGLAGSGAAFLLALTLGAFLPDVTGSGAEGTISAWRSAVATLMVYSAQVSASYLMLRRIGRLDGLVPYLVADNWATFFVTILSVGLAAFGFAHPAFLVFFGVITIVIEVNIARLIVTLAPMQIVGFILVQMLFAFIALLALTGLGVLPMEAIQ